MVRRSIRHNAGGFGKDWGANNVGKEFPQTSIKEDSSRAHE